jgi:multidrug efflux pump subunit AcrA (membrane-fusion protein)
METVTTRAEEASVTVLDQVHWSSLADGTAPERFAAAWLALQCRLLHQPLRAVLLLRRNGAIGPAARWPENDAGSPGLADIADLALRERRGAASRGKNQAGATEDGRPAHLAFPLLLGGEVEAVVAIEAAIASDAALREAMRQLQWGIAWIELLRRRGEVQGFSARQQQSLAALEAVASALSAECLEDAARAVATELAVRFNALRVSVGWVRYRRMRVIGISHTLGLSARSDLARDLGAAMDEASDQAATLLHPGAGGRLLGLRSHAALAERHGAAAILTVPMAVQDGGGGENPILGAITLECADRAAIDQATIDVLEAVAALVGPALSHMARSERWLAAIALDIAARTARQLFGAEHYVLKLGTMAAAALVGFFALYQTEYRVGAHAVVEGEVRRSIAASIDGYIATEHARAGQVVHKGDVLATLDANELNLQRLRWIATREQHRLELNRALASGQRADVNIDGAQISEAEAEIALLDEEISRTSITAPFDALVINGDLSQSVGVPVQRAQILFELAPLDSYRVIVRVPDSDIGRIAAGQAGSLVLTALPDENFPLRITAITPVAEQFDGINGFRVEARLDRVTSRLRPNMEGIAKLSTGRHHLIWIWTHHAIEAVRLWLWSWWP